MATKGRRGNGEGSIYQRSDGRWAAVVDVGREGGKRRRKTLYGRTRKEVAERLKIALRAQQQGLLPTGDDRQTVSAFLEWWLAEVVENTVRPSTAVSYATKVRKHIAPEIGHVPLTKLGPADVQALLNRKLAAGQSARSVQYIHAILRRSLGQAERWGLVPRNVAKLVDPPRVVRPEIVPLSRDEARALLAAAHGDRLEALYTVGIALGLRQGEALALRWDDVDLEEATLRVKRTVQRIRGELVYGEPKSARSRRALSLPAASVEALKAHRRRQLAERLAAFEWEDNDLVFCTQAGRPLDARNVARHFDRMCERAGLGHRRFHDLRHTTASLLLEQGVHPRVVMELLGHSQFSLTMNNYSHVMPVLQREAANRMDEVLG